MPVAPFHNHLDTATAATAATAHYLLVLVHEVRHLVEASEARL